MAQEMMHPLSVREAAGRRLIAPGSTNVLHYVYQIECSRPRRGSAWIGFTKSKRRMLIFTTYVFGLCVHTFCCLMEQQRPLINTVSAMPGRQADWRPVGTFSCSPSSALALLTAIFQKSWLDLKKDATSSPAVKESLLPAVRREWSNRAFLFFFFPFVLSGRA